MELTDVVLVAAGMLCIAGLPFAMAWVERRLMTSTEGGRRGRE